MTKFSVVRKHEIHTGHRVYGHQGGCGNLHGHSYVFHFHCSSENLDDLGMVIDFAIIKSTLCKWLDDNYDHRMILWKNDPLASELKRLDSSVVIVPYNPTAENIANHLLSVVAPKILHGTQIKVTKVVLEETAKCSASCEL
ncbi:MAG TPA: 6-carboxytetrahydropterin synthase [Aquella sp.]|nr:6-carboxytetrahydropterin synthase [Aquella sp.]